MSLRLKANGIFALASLLALVVLVPLIENGARSAARAEAGREASLLTGEAAIAAQYTRDTVAPAFGAAAGGASVVFVPATAPFYAVEQQARLLNRARPGSAVRRVVLDPVGDEDRPDAWEHDAIRRFRASPNPRPFTTVRDAPDGTPHLILVTPLPFAPGVCATCYTSRAAAPVGLVDAFGGAAGFDFKPGDIVGATVASVPLAPHATGVAGTAIAALVAAVVLLWLALNAVLEFVVLRPLGRVVAVADRVSLGKTGVQEFDHAGNDEIGTLTRSFNRLRRSMESAIGLIDT